MKHPKARKFLLTVLTDTQVVRTVGVHATIKGDRPTWEELSDMTTRAGAGPNCGILFMMEIDPS